MINGQYWIINNGLEVADSRGIAGFEIGSEKVTSESKLVGDSRKLRRDFQKTIQKLGIEDLVTGPLSLAELARSIPTRR